jgi:nicotinate-nucleotide pyrophosphorylase (carboxylating)
VKLFSQLEWLNVNALLKSALQEDLGQGDITTAATVAPGQRGRADIIVKETPRIVFCGGVLLAEIFRLACAYPEIAACAYEGRVLERGDTAAVIEGRLGGLLIGERTALNLVQLMSGISTITRRYVDAVAGTGARIIDTRKTHPGLRTIEKYAVRAGGGFNHRFGLDSGVLIKENHIAAAGGIGPVMAAAQKSAKPGVWIQIEVENLGQLKKALDAGATMILLDNMSPDQMREAVKIAGDRAELEASGGITLENVRTIAETGVHRISIGGLTKDVKAVDFSMRFET